MAKFRVKDIAPHFKGSVKDIVKNICGEKLDSGTYRDVYVLKQNEDYVVKVERNMSEGVFANATEWRNYINNRDWILIGPWLASCELINETGQVLIQRRVYTEGRLKKEYPKLVPVVFTDLKYKNFGWTSTGEFVCCDYSFFVTPMSNKKMKNARWWSNKPMHFRLK